MHLDINTERIQLNILKDLFLVQPKRGWLQLNLNDYRLSLKKRNEAFFKLRRNFYNHFKVHSYSNCHRSRGSEEKSNLSRNNKKSESCRVFSFSSAIIIGFLSVIELQRGIDSAWDAVGGKFFECSRSHNLSYCHREERESLIRSERNFFRNTESMTRFMNSRFKSCNRDVSQSQSHFNSNSWFPPFFLRFFSFGVFPFLSF